MKSMGTTRTAHGARTANTAKRILAIVCSVCIMSVLLVGCSAEPGESTKQHHVINPGKACDTCHDLEETYDLEASDIDNILEVGTTVTVQTDAEEVTVCVPNFTKEDGSKYTPEAKTVTAVENGEATLELEEGIWAICLDNGGDDADCILVSATADGEAATLEL